MDLKVGDVVILKSSGPAMTIQEIADYGFGTTETKQAKCIWFDKDHKKFEDLFALETLEICKAPEGPVGVVRVGNI
jgi:uncharacterized protein YodC (DUF2158 family)